MYFYFSYDSYYLNKSKANFYLQKINEEMDGKFLYNNAVFNDIENALFFIREFDLIYSPKNDSLSEYLEFFFDVSSSDQNQSTNLDSKHFEKKSINIQFYEGLGNIF